MVGQLSDLLRGFLLVTFFGCALATFKNRKQAASLLSVFFLIARRMWPWSNSISTNIVYDCVFGLAETNAGQIYTHSQLLVRHCAT